MCQVRGAVAVSWCTRHAVGPRRVQGLMEIRNKNPTGLQYSRTRGH